MFPSHCGCSVKRHPFRAQRTTQPVQRLLFLAVFIGLREIVLLPKLRSILFILLRGGLVAYLFKTKSKVSVGLCVSAAAFFVG
ncbi:hypothetical protein GQ43DRAFT_440969 [Delitschia confertaspora ATCC 74209]|uniref:Uncharacterized protein n=1 Tax=Delitschia confertaspora ATCC 74209 TaxID=1513339 RepID=A0A9P4JKY3_9PLEO|nr:hypothetical protein GQ43DRAFT_440969 [Delitschia confertaspora ATCC 74209]